YGRRCSARPPPLRGWSRRGSRSPASNRLLRRRGTRHAVLAPSKAADRYVPYMPVGIPRARSGRGARQSAFERSWIDLLFIRFKVRRKILGGCSLGPTAPVYE